jgi:1,4-dihydroxy-2-naphthoate octaprenyltransferase
LTDGLSLLEEAKEYPDATLTFTDVRGFPFSLKCKVSIDSANQRISVNVPSYVNENLSGKKVNVLFNSVVPLPGGGYTGRKYIVFWGTAEKAGNSIQFRPEKSYNWDENKVHFVQYCEISVRRGRRYMEKISEEIQKPVRPQLTRFWLFLRATRLPFLTATLIPVMLGSALAASSGHFSPLLFLLTLVGAAMIHLAVNTANDFFDFKIGADNLNMKPTPYSGGSRVIQYGLLRPSAIIGISTIYFFAGTGIGIYLAIMRATFILPAIIVAGLFLSVFYTAPPVKLAYRGFGELAVFLGFGPIMLLGAYYVQTSTLSFAALASSVPVGLLTAMILFVNEIPDRDSDREAGKGTLVVKLKEHSISKVYASLLVFVYASILISIVFRALPLLSIISLITIPLGLRVYKGVRTKSDNPYFMIPTMATSIKLHLYTGLLLIASVVVSIWIH